MRKTQRQWLIDTLPHALIDESNVTSSCDTHLEVGLSEAAGHGDHGGGERPRDADAGEELGDVWRQAEWHGPVGVQVARGVVDVEAEVGDVELARVLLLEKDEKVRYT